MVIVCRGQLLYVYCARSDIIQIIIIFNVLPYCICIHYSNRINTSTFSTHYKTIIIIYYRRTNIRVYNYYVILCKLIELLRSHNKLHSLYSASVSTKYIRRNTRYALQTKAHNFVSLSTTNGNVKFHKTMRHSRTYLFTKIIFIIIFFFLIQRNPNAINKLNK